MVPVHAHPDDVVLFIANTLNGKGRWFHAISEVLFSKAEPNAKSRSKRHKRCAKEHTT